MKCKTDSGAKVLFGCFNTILFACGFVEVVCGFLLLSDGRRLVMSRLLASPESGLTQPPLQYLALALLAAGVAVCAVAALGCWAAYMPGYVVLTIYFLAVLALLLAECAGGAAAALWPRCAGLASARGGALGALQTYYAAPDYEHFTASVDLVQTELKCCGVSEARNYEMSVWQLHRLGPRGMFVPLSCCVQHANNASHLTPAPVDPARCQEINPNEYRHNLGCMDKLEDWYQQQYLIFMLALFIFACFKLGVLLTTIFSCIRLKRRRQVIHSITLRTVDNNTNENIYESKFARDEHITKYIQPNNFYTPRARNPRIFPNKPNEMV